MNTRIGTLVASALATLLLIGCGGESDPSASGESSEADAPPARIEIGHVGHDHHIALFVAALEPEPIEKLCGVSLVEKLRKEVYDLVEDGEVLAGLRLSKVGGGSKMPAAMERGEIDVGLGGIPAVMFFVDKGAPFKILCPLNVDGDMLLLRPELPADDWAGFVKYVKESETPVKIGYKAPVAVAKLVLEGALDAEGIPYAEEGVPGGVELVNLRGGGKIVPSLEKGMVDGAVINEPFGSIAEYKKVGKIVSLLSELPPEGRWEHHPCCCICATEDAISGHRRALVALLKLVHHTTDFIHANPEAASRLAAEWTANEPEVEAASVPNIVYTTAADDAYREGMKTWFEIMKEVGQFEGILEDKGWEESFELGHDLTLRGGHDDALKSRADDAPRTPGGVARALILGSLLPLLVVLVWHVASRGDTTLVPTVGEVVRVLAHPFEEPRLDEQVLAHGVLVSLVRVLLGFGAAFLVAVPLGVAVGRLRAFRQVFSPVIEMARPICPVAWLPILILIFGDASAASLLYGEEAWKHRVLDHVPWAMVVVIFSGAFFPIFINTVHGVTHVKTLFVEVATTNGASRAQVFRHVVLPGALPAIMAGTRIGLGIAWLVIVAAEFYPGTRSGLAYMITTADEVGKFNYVFACIIMIGSIGLVMNAVLRRIEDRVSRWQARER